MRARLGHLGKRLSPLYFIFALILVSALALGTYSYIKATQLADQSERSLAQSERSLADSNRLLGEQIRDRIDNFIIDSDRAMIDIVDLEHLTDFARRWTEIIRLSQPVEAALVLDERQELVKDGYVSKRRGAEYVEFRDLFQSKILPQLELAGLRLELHKHLHAVIDGRDYLFSYIKREQRKPGQPNRVFYVVLKINLDYLVQDFFREAFQPMRGRVLYAVVDNRNRVLFGERVPAPRELLYDEHFPTTLYLWRMQMAPPNAEQLAAEAQARRLEAHARRVSDSTLIALMVSTILGGIAFLLYAVAKERRANQLKSDFISNVSHELKTPLSLIRMFAELLALGKLKTPEKGKEYAEIITREAERLSRLIDNVLDFARMERGKAAYDFKPGDLSEVVARSVDVYRYRLEREGVRLRTEIAEALPETLLDENAMTLVLLNLLDNAVKYGATPDGEGAKPAGGEIVVGLKEEAGGLRLTVRDHGPGIDRDEQKKIFDRFYRSRSARGKKNARGSGIGLSLVKHIAEAHGGRVTVDSAPGEGATFAVSIPLRSAPEPGREERAA
ncbi:MAG: HAMP domain-containing histidine kinase [Myxococcales bacterium]|nr:HAMP domain-containing histidine kinase [Myxococcales bacterium]